MEYPEFLVVDEIIMLADYFRNLGVQFDCKMCLDKQITFIVKMSFVNLKDMYQVRSCLSLDSLQTMAHVFITSRLDYGKSFLCGLPQNQIKKFQAIVARLVTNSYKYDLITHILKDLHRLPVQQQINFKILLFTFKCLHGQAPKYLQDLLTWSQPKGLLSDNKLLPVVPKSKQVTDGDCASFSIAAPRL